tara:strand:- start:404 stop:598 length:195 start_codon:yes stop_codon:yes gene_type:complete
MIGQKKYDEEMDVMTQLVAQEEKQEKFKAVSGDVDRRDISLHDIELTDGYSHLCGFKGGKLSGG